jgi:hypothetical protein
MDDITSTGEFTAIDLGAARAWIADAFEDVYPVDAWALQPLAVVRAIREHYAGGVAQFLADR